MLEMLKKLNPEIPFYSVSDKEFESFGRVIENIDASGIINAAKNMEKPESGSVYIPSVEAFEATEAAKRIEKELFGTLPAQIGYCFGHNKLMNATEWHTSSEINIAVTPIVLILGHLWDVRDNRIDSSCFKAFYLPAGTVVEVFATSLHFCPCETEKEGFGCAVGLPRGTNTELETEVEDRLLYRRNKWLIAHDDNEELKAKGAAAGISGTNFEIKYQ